MTEVAQADIQLGGTAQFSKDAGNVKAGLAGIGQSMELTRNQALFLSFGMYAMAGIINKAVNITSQLQQTMMEATRAVEQQATVVNTLLPGIEDNFGSVRQEMIRLGIETEFTSKQAGQAMERLAMSGFEMNEVLQATESTLSLATIGMIDTGEAADLTAGIIRSFNLDASDLEATVAEVAYAITNSANTATDLGEALKFVGAIASQLSLEFEGINAFLMNAGNNMIRGGIAGRGLRQSLLNLSKALGITTDEGLNAGSVIEQYGLELTNADGSMIQMIDIADELNNKLGDLTATQKLAALSALFGARAATAWAAALDDEAIAQMKKWEYEMQVASARTTIHSNIVENSAEVLGTWVNQLQAGQTAIDYFTEELGYSVEAAIDIENVLVSGRETIKQYTEEGMSAADATARWVEEMEAISSVSEIVRERLQTLNGSIILLQASMDTMWESIGSQMAPVMQTWNNLIRITADALAKMPPWLATIIGLGIILITVFGGLFAKTLMLLGSFIMMIAAFKAMGKDMMKVNIDTKMLSASFKFLRIETQKLTWEIIKLTVGGFLKLMAVIAPLILIFLVAEHVSIKYGKAAGWLTGIVLTLAYAYVFLNAKIYKTQRAIVAKYMAQLKEVIITKSSTAANIADAYATWKLNTANRAAVVSLMGVKNARMKVIAGQLWSILLKVKDYLVTKMFTIQTWFGVAANYALSNSFKALTISMLPVLGIMGAIALAIGAVAMAMRDQEEVADETMAHSTIPDAFKSGSKHIRKTLGTLEHDIKGTDISPNEPSMGSDASGFGNKTVYVAGPSTTVTMGNITLSGTPKDLEKMKFMVKQGVEEAVRKSNREWAKRAAQQGV